MALGYANLLQYFRNHPGRTIEALQMSVRRRRVRYGSEQAFPNKDKSLVLVQQLSGPDVDSQIRSIQQIIIQILSLLRKYSASRRFLRRIRVYAIITFRNGRKPLLDELRLASILGRVSSCLLVFIVKLTWQVLDGLSYLEKNGLEHGRLTCSNILIDQNGNIKLCKSL